MKNAWSNINVPFTSSLILWIWENAYACVCIHMCYPRLINNADNESVSFSTFDVLWRNVCRIREPGPAAEYLAVFVSPRRAFIARSVANEQLAQKLRRDRADHANDAAGESFAANRAAAGDVE